MSRERPDRIEGSRRRADNGYHPPLAAAILDAPKSPAGAESGPDRILDAPDDSDAAEPRIRIDVTPARSRRVRDPRVARPAALGRRRRDGATTERADAVEPPVVSPRDLAAAYAPAVDDAEAACTAAEAPRSSCADRRRDGRHGRTDRRARPPPDRIVDLWRLDALRGIALDGDVLVLGALTTYTEIRRSPSCREHAAGPRRGGRDDRRGADPEPRHARRQHRECLAGRRHAAGPARRRCRVRRSARRAASETVAAAEFWTGYRTTALAAGRADPARPASRSGPGARCASARSARDAPSRSARSCWRSPGASASPVALARRPRSRSAPWPPRRSGPPPPRPSSRAPPDPARSPTARPRRWPASSSRSTTSARRPSTGGWSRRASCIGSSARPAAGEGDPRRPPLRRRSPARCAPCSRARRGSWPGSSAAGPFASRDQLFADRPLDRPRDARGRAGRAGRRASPPRRPARHGLGAELRRAGVRPRAAGTAPVDVAAELERLNDAYEARFGFRYCVFVAGRPREALLPGMAAALEPTATPSCTGRSTRSSTSPSTVMRS